MSEQKTAESAQIDAETEQELQEFLEVTETEVEVLNARVATQRHPIT